MDADDGKDYLRSKRSENSGGKKRDDLILGSSWPKPKSGADVALVTKDEAATVADWIGSLAQLLETYVKEFNRAADEENFEIFIDNHVDDEAGLIGVELNAAGVAVTVMGDDDSIVAYMTLAEDDEEVPEQRKIFRMPPGNEHGTFSFQNTDIDLNQVALPAKKIFALFLEQAGEAHSRNPQPRGAAHTEEQDQEEENQTMAQAGSMSGSASEEIQQLNGLLVNFIGAEISEEPHANTGLSNLLGAREDQSAEEEHEPQSSNSGEVDMLETKEVSVFDACEMLRRAVGSELDNLTREGMRAFERQDMQAVQGTMVKVNKIKALQERIYESLDEWQTELSED